jgi:hypothetical protein
MPQVFSECTLAERRPFDAIAETIHGRSEVRYGINQDRLPSSLSAVQQPRIISAKTGAYLLDTQPSMYSHLHLSFLEVIAGFQSDRLVFLGSRHCLASQL